MIICDEAFKSIAFNRRKNLRFPGQIIGSIEFYWSNEGEWRVWNWQIGVSHSSSDTKLENAITSDCFFSKKMNENFERENFIEYCTSYFYFRKSQTLLTTRDTTLYICTTNSREFYNACSSKSTNFFPAHLNELLQQISPAWHVSYSSLAHQLFW